MAKKADGGKSKKELFSLFGNMNTEELNQAAEGLKNEGDRESLLKLAAENGIDQEDAEDYMEGVVEEFCSPVMAALGKLQVEAGTVNTTEIMADWLDYIRQNCAEVEGFAAAVRDTGKSLKGCIAELLTWSYKNCYAVDKEICKLAGVPGNCKLGIPGMARAKKIITEYYTGKKVSA